MPMITQKIRFYSSNSSAAILAAFLLVLVSESIPNPLAFELDRFKCDLVGDGRVVHAVFTADAWKVLTCAAAGHRVAISAPPERN